MPTLDKPGMKQNRHHSSMISTQRKELIRILSVPIMGHSLQKLAEATDEELHELWLIDCDYPNPYKK